MMSRIFSLRSLALVAVIAAGSAFSASSDEAGGCHPQPKVVYVPAQPVYVVRPVTVRKVVVVHPAPVYRPSCH